MEDERLSAWRIKTVTLVCAKSCDEASADCCATLELESETVTTTAGDDGAGCGPAERKPVAVGGARGAARVAPVSVQLVEAGDAGSFGAHVWPSAFVLARAVVAHAASLPSRRGPLPLMGCCVVELGAGCGLPGLAAAMLGARVTLTDAANDDAALRTCAAAVEANSPALPSAGGAHAVSVMPHTWGAFTGRFVSEAPAPDLVLGADVLYDTSQFDAVFASARWLLERGRRAGRSEGAPEWWVAYHPRASQRSLRPLLLKWGMTAETLPLPEDVSLRVGGEREEGAESKYDPTAGSGDAAIDSSVESASVMLFRIRLSQ